MPVPSILNVGETHFVAEWHPDAPDPNHPGSFDQAWARAAGEMLGTLHAETEPLSDGYGSFDIATGPDASVELATPNHETWRDGVLAYLELHRAGPAAHGHGDVVDAVIEYVETHPDAFADADQAVWCHGWATPEHVSVSNERVTCVVDFEHVIAAPPAFDYWRTVLPTFDDEIADARRAFRDGYESVRDLQSDLEANQALYVLLSLVYYLESLYVQDQFDATATAERAQHFRTEIHELLDGLD